jgi:type III pantothenate kinase
VKAVKPSYHWGYVGLIEGLLTRIKAEMKAEPIVVATGGLAPLFAEGTKAIAHIDADLTIIGLLEIYNNRKN